MKYWCRGNAHELRYPDHGGITVAAPGQLTRTVHTISSGEQVGSHSVALAYDTLGRLMGREVSIDGNASLDL